jgi:hypothetical protein
MGAFARVAPQLHGYGLNVLPADAEEKRPLIKWRHRGWKDVRQTGADVQQLLNQFPRADVAVILGPGSALYDLEADSATGEEALRHLGPLPPTACFESRRGPHRLYRCVDLLPTCKEIVPGAEFRGRGAITIVPPAAGREWILPVEHLAELPEEWRERVLLKSHLAGGTPTAAHHPSSPATTLQGLNCQEASLEYTRDLLPGDLRQMFGEPVVVTRACAALGIATSEVGSPFQCVLPDHRDEHPWVKS